MSPFNGDEKPIWRFFFVVAEETVEARKGAPEKNEPGRLFKVSPGFSFHTQFLEAAPGLDKELWLIVAGRKRVEKKIGRQSVSARERK